MKAYEGEPFRHKHQSRRPWVWPLSLLMATCLFSACAGKESTAPSATTVPVSSVAVTPATATVQVGQTVQLTATAKDASGNVLPGRTVTWASSNTAVATVSGSGLVTGVAAGGPVTITATSEGQSGTAAVTVAVNVVALPPIAYNKPGFLDLDVWFIRPDGTGDTFAPITYKPGLCDACRLLGAQRPAWSRDGQLIAVTGLIPGTSPTLQGGYAMVLYRPSSGDLKLLAALGTAFGGGPAAFSPDGTQLAYSDLGLNFTDYRVINVDGSNPRDITPGIGAAGGLPIGLDWSPVNANILVLSMLDPSLSNVSGNTELAFVPPIQNGIVQARPLTQPPYVLGVIFSDMFPAFSPDGRFVAFVRVVNNTFFGTKQTEIRAIDINNPGDRQGQLLIQLPVGDVVYGLSWSSDGTSLIFDRGVYNPFLPLLGQGSKGLWIYKNGSMLQIQPQTATAPAWRK